MNNCLVACVLVYFSSFCPANAVENTITLYRCIDIKGQVSLQDVPCPKDVQQSTLQRSRPQDPPAPQVATQVQVERKPLPTIIEPAREVIPPPPALYRCTSYDGIERYSEQYDPNPRCEPLVLYFPEPHYLTPQQASACRWVEDSCVRLSDQAVCALWKKKKEAAASAVLHAFSDTAAYRKSELQRTTQIVEESCP